MKYYVKQIPVEQTISPLYYTKYEELPEGIIITGNKHFQEFTNIHWDAMMKYRANIENDITSDPVEQIELVKYYYINMDNETALHFAQVVYNNEWTNEQDYFCKLFSIYTGKEYTYQSITGSVQGEWNYIYYPAGTDDKTIEYIETEYFNTGYEYMIHDDQTTPEGPEDITGYCVYVHEWSTEGIKQELSDCIGCKPEDILLYTISCEHTFTKYDYTLEE